MKSDFKPERGTVGRAFSAYLGKIYFRETGVALRSDHTRGTFLEYREWCYYAFIITSH